MRVARARVALCAAAPQVLPPTAEAVAAFLATSRGLSKRRIGDYLGESSEFVQAVLLAYTQRFDFHELPFVEAVRAYLSPFRLPGEAQKIDRIMCTFSAHYCDNNPHVFADADAACVPKPHAHAPARDAHVPVRTPRAARLSSGCGLVRARGHTLGK